MPLIRHNRANNNPSFLILQAISKPKTDSKDDDSDVEFVPIPQQSPTKNENGKIGASDGADSLRNHSLSISAMSRASTDDKRPSTSITIKNSKPVISSRTASMARGIPTPLPTKRILNVSQKLHTEPPPHQTNESDAKLPTATRTVNVVTRQTDGTVILRKVQMAPKANVVAAKRPLTNHSQQKTQVHTYNGSAAKRLKIDDRPTLNPIIRPKDIDTKRKSMVGPSSTSTRSKTFVRPKAPIEMNKLTARQRRITSADNLQPQDSEKLVTMTPLSASEHQYAKRTNENEACTPDTEKPSPQTPLSATEHHYSKRNNDTTVTFPTPSSMRNRWRPTMATATVVATAADSTRTDDIKSGSMTIAPSLNSPILLNEMLSKIKPSIRVRTVQSLNNNAKNG